VRVHIVCVCMRVHARACACVCMRVRGCMIRALQVFRSMLQQQSYYLCMREGLRARAAVISLVRRNELRIRDSGPALI